MEKWLKLAIEIQSLAQSGLAYTKNPYDIERYERLRDISAEMLTLKTEMSFEKAKDIFCNESGYQTPKLDTRAAVFKDGKILLVHENNGTWSLPGGCSPIGMKKPFKTVIDTSAQNYGTIIFSGGKIGYQIEISLDELKKALNFKLEEITVES